MYGAPTAQDYRLNAYWFLIHVGFAEEWRPVLKKAYIQQKHMPPPKSISQKRVLEEELPRPYRILSPFSPYSRYRTHKRLTVYVDKNNIVEDVECS
ncbi:hypothetical protein IWW55_000193 [Coemansia sp. RSA 2706]|nr:hypothetical protein IWW55_000193 [Coemansia sp. RSA 2706]